MSSARQFIAKMLEDRKIDENEVAQISDYITQDGVLDIEDVKLLVRLYCESDSHPDSFDKLFFEVLRSVMTEDGQISASERYYLLKMIYADGEIRPVELEFLKQLKADGANPCPEFDTMLKRAESADPTDWGVGGAPR